MALTIDPRFQQFLDDYMNARLEEISQRRDRARQQTMVRIFNSIESLQKELRDQAARIDALYELARVERAPIPAPTLRPVVPRRVI